MVARSSVTLDTSKNTRREVVGSSLREIDRLATAAMREAARRKKKLVERDVMTRVVGDLQPDAG
jgi:hypothetical protein